MRKNKILAIAMLAAVILCARPAKSRAVGELMRGVSLPDVYYITSNATRLAFPDQQTYFSWYPDFSGVQTVNDSDLARFPLAGNVTMRPGVKMIKIKSDPKVYAVAEGGTLRWITSEQEAWNIYGQNWNKQVVDVSDTLFTDYRRGDDITGTDAKGSFTTANAIVNSPTIDIERNKILASRSTPASPPTQTGCAYGNPACPAAQSCINNLCQTPNQIVVPTPQATPACSTPSCLDPRQTAVYDAPASVKSVSMLKVGDSWTVAPGRFLRIESITPSQSVISLWASDAKGCRFTDRLVVYGADQKNGVAFGDVYLDALQLNGGIYADVFAGSGAYSACIQAMNAQVELDKQQNITLNTGIATLNCASLPGAGRYTVTSTDGLFRRLYKDSAWTPAESVLVDANDVWYKKLISLFPAFAESRPLGDAWHITEFTDELPYAGMLMSNGMISKMDNQLTSQLIGPLNTDVTFYNKVRADIASGNTSGWPDAPIEEAHELGHVLTAPTQLLGSSPAGYSTILGEGVANYLEGYSVWSKAVADQYANDLHCQDATFGTDNKPYSSNLTDYYAGQCFYYLYAKYCGGQAALNDAFADFIDQTYHPSDTKPSAFSMLDAHCQDHAKFHEILTNYGITDKLINKTGPLMVDLLPGNACSAQ